MNNTRHPQPNGSQPKPSVGHLTARIADLENRLGVLEFNVPPVLPFTEDLETQADHISIAGVMSWNRGRRRKSIVRGIEELRNYMAAPQTTTPLCPCGNHRGIRFAGLNDNMCPVRWWFKQSRLAFEEDRLGQFLHDTPLEDFIKWYIITT